MSVDGKAEVSVDGKAEMSVDGKAEMGVGLLGKQTIGKRIPGDEQQLWKD